MTSENNNGHNSEFLYIKKGKFYTFAFTWTIKNFEYLSKRNNQLLEFQQFQTGPIIKRHNWQLKVRTQYRDFQLVDRRQMIEVVISTSTNIQFATVKITLQEKDPVSFFVDIYPSRSQGERIRTKVKKTVFLGVNQRTYECNDSLQIRFDAKVILASVSTFIRSDSIQYEYSLSNFSNYLSSILKSGEFSDFTLKVQEKEFHVHRAILAANSPRFEEMFEQHSGGPLEMTDFEPEVVEGMLLFMYTHKEPNFEKLDFVEKLFTIADQYRVDDLKAICESHLISIMTDTWNVTKGLRDNVIDFLRSADPEFRCSSAKSSIDK